MEKTRRSPSFLTVLVLFVVGLLSSTPSQAQENHFQVGEELTYEVYYHLWGVWVGAGTVVFSVDEEEFRGKNCFLFEGVGTTHKRYDWFFKVRDTYTALSTLNELKPQKFTRNVSEGNFYFFEQNLYNHPTEKIYSVLRVKERPMVVDTIPLEDDSFDVLTMMYRYRDLDFDSYEVGERIPINMVIDRQTHHLYLKYLGKDIYTHEEYGEIECHVIAPLLVAGSIFKEGERMRVWFSADENRIPIYVESDIRIGSIRSEVKSIRGLKYPLGG